MEDLYDVILKKNQQKRSVHLKKTLDYEKKYGLSKKQTFVKFANNLKIKKVILKTF